MVESKLNKQALDSYTKSFSIVIMDEFFNKNTSVSGQQIVELTPIKQLNFFVLKVLFSQWQEETKKFKSPYFDYNNESVKQSLKSLVNTLSKNISIDKNAFGPLLEIAVKDTLTLIFDPKSYFNKEVENIIGNNLASAFKSLSRYIKLNKDGFIIISKELAEGNIEKGSAELSALIHKSCEQLNLENNEEDINLFDELLTIDFIIEEEEEILTAKIDTTLEDQEIELLEEEIEPEEVPAKVESLEKEEDFGVDEKGLKPEELELKEEEKEDLDGSSINLDDEFSPVDKEPAKLVDKGIEDEDIEDEASNTTDNISEEVEEELPTNINEQFISDTQTINDQFEETEKITTIAEKHETSPISELHSSINVNERYMFLNDLFEGDENEYNSAIASIEECESFDESVEYLMQNYSRKFQWNMGSDEVKELLKVIFKRFR
jgi:hypothetical protein